MLVRSERVNRENMNKLADALVSGKYVQGIGVLRRSDNTFCCLGVACDISGLGNWEKSKLDRYHYVIQDVFNQTETGRSLLPKSMTNWLGISDCGSFKVPGSPKRIFSLTELNDEDMTFSQIADILRSEAIEWLVDED